MLQKCRRYNISFLRINSYISFIKTFLLILKKKKTKKPSLFSKHQSYFLIINICVFRIRDIDTIFYFIFLKKVVHILYYGPHLIESKLENQMQKKYAHAHRMKLKSPRLFCTKILDLVVITIVG